MNKAFTLKTFPDAALLVTIAVADVVTIWTAVLPVMVVVLTIFGAAIFFPYPKTIAIAMAFPLVAMLVESLASAKVPLVSRDASVVADALEP
jgi:signal transduction histidine kinase